jgi:formylglycine-generating enzyme required for sulfatase activity
MVVVPAGEFMMGYDSEKHKVAIKAPFAVGRFAVTFDEWDAAGLAPKPDDSGWGRGRRPVINVSWKDAKSYAGWLSQKTGKVYRLLSEAEWEYCCRAGTTTAFWWGDAISTQQANYNGNHTYRGGQKGEYRRQTIAVNSFEPNPWGLYQIHGNVWEWCEDNWHAGYKGAPQDGSVRQGGESLRVRRGGSWHHGPDYLHAAVRDGIQPDNRDYLIGFRLARTL